MAVGSLNVAAGDEAGGMEAEDVAEDGRKTGEEEVTMDKDETHDPRNEDPWDQYPEIGKDGLIPCKTVHNTTQAMLEVYVEDRSWTCLITFSPTSNGEMGR